MNKVLNKYNKGGLYNHKTKGTEEYTSLEELYNNFKDKPIKVLNFYINKKSLYGDYPIAVTENFLVNLPQHLLDTVLEMLQDEEVAEIANNGKLGMTIYKYKGKKWGGYSVNWVVTE